MRRLLPSPLLSCFLFGLWLVLNQTLAPAHLLAGASLAILVPALTAGTRPLRPRIRRPWLLVSLAARVLADVMLSCVRVSVIILGGAHRRTRSGFMDVPLDLRDPHGLAVLASIVNSTPGTVWCELSEDRSLLTLHVLDLHDEQAWVDLIKNRYEKPLRAIFE